MDFTHFRANVSGSGRRGRGWGRGLDLESDASFAFSSSLTRKHADKKKLMTVFAASPPTQPHGTGGKKQLLRRKRRFGASEQVRNGALCHFVSPRFCQNRFELKHQVLKWIFSCRYKQLCCQVLFAAELFSSLWRVSIAR